MEALIQVRATLEQLRDVARSQADACTREGLRKDEANWRGRVTAYNDALALLPMIEREIEAT